MCPHGRGDSVHRQRDVIWTCSIGGPDTGDAVHLREGHQLRTGPQVRLEYCQKIARDRNGDATHLGLQAGLERLRPVGLGCVRELLDPAEDYAHSRGRDDLFPANRKIASLSQETKKFLIPKYPLTILLLATLITSRLRANDSRSYMT